MVLAVFAGSALFYFLFFFPYFQVSAVSVFGAQKVSVNKIEEVFWHNVSRKIIDLDFFQFSTKSIFWADSDKINSAILEHFPAVESAVITKVFPGELKIDVSERKAVGVYCNDSEFATNCFLIDANAVIFEQVAALPGGSFIVRQSFTTGEDFVGKKVMAESLINAIVKIQNNLQDNFKINLTQAFVTSPLRLDATTSENWQIYFNLEQGSDIDIQIAKLNLLLEDAISPEARKSLQYVDLRFKDRAFYK